jgi:hypothetical protein
MDIIDYESPRWIEFVHVIDKAVNFHTEEDGKTHWKGS